MGGQLLSAGRVDAVGARPAGRAEVDGADAARSVELLAARRAGRLRGDGRTADGNGRGGRGSGNPAADVLGSFSLPASTHRDVEFATPI